MAKGLRQTRNNHPTNLIATQHRLPNLPRHVTRLDQLV